MRNGNGVLMGATNTKDLRQLLLPFFVNGTDRRSLQLFVALMSAVIAVSLGLMAWTVVIVNGLITHFLPADLITGLGVMVDFAGWLVQSRALAVLTVLSVLAGGLAAWPLRGMDYRRRVAWLYVLGSFWLLLIVNSIVVLFTYFFRDLTNSFVARDVEGSRWGLVQIFVLFGVFVPAIYAYNFTKSAFANFWREAMTLRFFGAYLGGRFFYRLSSTGSVDGVAIDNPDQRIAQDIDKFTEKSSELFFELVDSCVSAASFAVVLITIDAWILFYVLVFAAFSTGLIAFIGKKLVRLNYVQLRLNADFRYSLTRVRDNAESIAFYSGEVPEQQESTRRLGSVVKNFNLLIIWQVVISAMQRSVGYAGVFFPYLVMAGPYFSGDIDYGRFVQAGFAFNMVEGSLLFVVNRIDDLAQFTAGVGRLEGFQSKVEQVSRDHLGVDPVQLGAASIVVRNADLTPPGASAPILRDLSLSVGETDRLLVVGPSGCGKTSLLRMISGLWSPSRGDVERPPTGELLFIPQRPYMLLGSLREQLCYPTEESRFSDDQLRHVLDEVKLGSLSQRYPDLDVKQDWPRILSLGEQQRLAFGRLLLNAPRFVVLDEATSALDVPTEEHLYALLRQRELSVISIGHRPTLKQFHDSVLELTGDGDWRLLPATSYDFDRS